MTETDLDRTRAWPRTPLALLRSVGLVLALCLGAGCGKEIGDECVINADCDPSGERQCLTDQREGYCTIQGCAFDSCPDEAVCVRFFTGGFTNRPCTHATEDNYALADPMDRTDDCSVDELCSVADICVPRSSEIRFCMRQCESNDDCRDGYECRGIALMREHGGEPVLDVGERVDDGSPKFCAAAPR